MFASVWLGVLHDHVQHVHSCKHHFVQLQDLLHVHMVSLAARVACTDVLQLTIVLEHFAYHFGGCSGVPVGALQWLCAPHVLWVDPMGSHVGPCCPPFTPLSHPGAVYIAPKPTFPI